ncbi:hypothetical protein BDP81DRAFT_442189 [Colletotrichum phormii]|uniref:Secreted protein n=1 Tax=Colletotrichum phormii TaxID=359342 RepID=A0AAI9ZCN5_9PEZI|nr:uncharacterized protein BDP81DRAFT_442189 [Colletotrichum phormii]KAK1622092.1 hypothetical protein BDP81DRAFT_442189 [Colletotrichum phormii]
MKSTRAKCLFLTGSLFCVISSRPYARLLWDVLVARGNLSASLWLWSTDVPPRSHNPGTSLIQPDGSGMVSNPRLGAGT